jgi:CRP-like cAMP-binding protein
VSREEASRILTERGWLGGQPQPFQDIVLSRGMIVRFAEDQPVYRVGDEPGGIYGVVGGSFGQFVSTPDNGLTLAHIVQPGDWFGFGPLFHAQQRTVAFQALEPAIALHMPLHALNDMTNRDPLTAMCLGSLGTACLASAAQAVANLLIRRSDQRIAATLLRAAGADAAGGTAASVLRISQSALGEMANASRHLVNRTLQVFDRSG